MPPAVAAVAIPAAASLAGGAMSSKGGKSQAEAAKTAANDARVGRANAMQATGLGNLGQLASTLFPGLLGGNVGSEQAGSPGGLAVQQLMGLLQNPGQLSSTTYERGQEQANIGEQAAKSAATQGLTGRGIDPNSAMGQSLAVSASLGAGRQRNEAARDYGLASETLKRQDIQTGTSGYLGFLQSIMGLGGQQAAAAVGGGFPQVAAINPYEGLQSGLGQFGQGMADYYKNKPTTPPAPTGGGFDPRPAGD